MKNICVFCGSSYGKKTRYTQAAEDFGKLLTKNNCRLIYGGGRLGLMGVLADATIQTGGEVYGVIPDFMIPREVAHTGLTRLITTGSMHERKSRMAGLADAFVVLPGGMGTLDEMAEIITWNQLGLIRKPLAILNTHGYFNPLLEMFGKMEAEGFLRMDPYQPLSSLETPGALLTHILTSLDSTHIQVNDMKKS